MSPYATPAAQSALWEQPRPHETPQLCTWCTNPTLQAARDACRAERCPYRQLPEPCPTCTAVLGLPS